MLKKESARIARHAGSRKKIIGTAARPRLSVHRSSKHLYIQLIDDFSEKTVFAFSSKDKEFSKAAPKSKKVLIAEKMGDFFGPRIKEKGINQIAFDRGGYRYHGRVKALADSLRKAGIQF
jgi:large subunit ribosomal protein L18